MCKYIVMSISKLKSCILFAQYKNNELSLSINTFFSSLQTKNPQWDFFHISMLHKNEHYHQYYHFIIYTKSQTTQGCTSTSYNSSHRKATNSIDVTLNWLPDFHLQEYGNEKNINKYSKFIISKRKSLCCYTMNYNGEE